MSVSVLENIWGCFHVDSNTPTRSSTTIIDNNTWNNTHIATVGLAMASSERKVGSHAYPITSTNTPRPITRLPNH